MKPIFLRGGAGLLVAALCASAAIAQVAPGAPAPTGVAAGEGAAAADYRVGPGDLLNISVYRANDLQSTVRVGINGTINFPSVGEVRVAGKTAGEIADMLTTELKQRGILVAPSVNVLVSEVRSKTVMVMGAVARPGESPIDRAGLTLASVLARAGASFGTGSGIVTVMENGAPDAPRQRYRISDLVSGGEDRPVHAGEILVVESAPVIYVSGEVGHPGAFPLETNLTVGQALALGGGVTPRGSIHRVRLTRKGANGATEVKENVKPDVIMMPGDLLFVKQRVF